MRKIYLTVSIVALALAVGLGWQVSRAQPGGERYFPQTGHYVSGEALAVYSGAPDPELLYGFPITELYEDKSIGGWVQYFQKARFELYPERPAGQRVQITPAGQTLYEYENGIPIQDDAAGCREFPQTGYRVCLSFLEFFERYGGIDQFGAPISNLEAVGERRVQYFEKARLEWRPELNSGERVQVGNLGLELFSLYREDPRRMEPESGIGSLLELKAHAYPLQAVIGPRGEQRIFVIVQNQLFGSIEGANVELTVRYPSGQEQSYALPATDENGIARSGSFPLAADMPGLVEVKVKVTLDTPDGFFETKTVTSFRIWR